MKNFLRHITTLGVAAACYGQPAPPAAPQAPAFQYDKADLDELRAKTDEMRAKADEMRAKAKEAASRIRDMNIDLDFHFDRDFHFDTDFKFEIDRDVNGQVQMAMQRAKEAMLWAQAVPSPKPSVAPMAPMAPKPPEPPDWPGGKRGRQETEERQYRRGADYLDKREWEKSVDEFDKVIERKGAKADGAYYWKAYALSKLGKRDLALASLAELKKSYPSSRWLNDAKALEVEVQQASGQGVSPENQSDEDLKLFAINSLMNTDPERALPLLEKILQKSTAPKLKERALFVLAQNRSSKSNEIVAQFARGGGNPDLQQKAVEYLGIYGGKDNLQILGDIYGSASDAGLKRNILRSFMTAHDKDRLLSAAKSEQNADLRRDAIQYLGNLNAYSELAQLYTTEQSVDVKESIIQSLANGNNAEKLIEIARTEKDARLRGAAIHRLGTMSRSKTSEALVSIYGGETDRNVKEQIIRALFIQNSGKELVDVARKESDPSLKRSAVQALSRMNTKEATDFMVELINK